jgi:hypothetical protein
MAAGQGFKTFATGDVLTAADTNGYLMQGVWVFADATARDAAVTSPQEGNFCYLKDTNVTQYYTGSAWAAVGGGKLLQVVNVTYGTETTSSSSTYADTGLTATITPSSATSKVLVIVTQQGVQKNAANALNAVDLRLLRGATSILTMGDYNASTGTALNLNIGSVSASYLDSPATTSATTYKTQFRNPNNTATVRVQSYDTAAGSALSTITLMEIGA